METNIIYNFDIYYFMKQLFFILAFFVAFTSAQAADFLITNYGVGNDSSKLSTAKIQSAIDKAEEAGGGQAGRVHPRKPYDRGPMGRVGQGANGRRVRHRTTQTVGDQV